MKNDEKRKVKFKPDFIAVVPGAGKNISITGGKRPSGVTEKGEKGEIAEQSMGMSKLRAAEHAAERRLSPKTLREVYAWSAEIRPIVDGISRTVSSLPRSIVSKNKKPLNRLERTTKAVIEKFFDTPNSNNDTFADILKMYVTDQLVLDAGVIEKVRGASGKLVEMSPVDGATIRIDADKSGNIKKYVQVISGKEGSSWTPKDMIYKKMFPRTNSIYGIPIIESIAVQVEAMLNGADDDNEQLSRGSIPPGVLALQKIGVEAYARFREDLTNGDPDAIKVLKNVEGIEWVSFGRTNSEKGAEDIKERLQKTIARNFGLSAIDIGITDGVNRSSGDIMERASRSKLIEPIAFAIEEMINDHILPEFKGAENLAFSFIIGKNRSSVEHKELSDAVTTYTKNGILSINEARGVLQRELGITDLFVPVPGGDKHFIQLGNRVLVVEDNEFMGEKDSASVIQQIKNLESGEEDGN